MKFNRSYSVGMAHPVSLGVQTFGTGEIADSKIADRLLQVIDFRLGAIVRDLEINRPARKAAVFTRSWPFTATWGVSTSMSPWRRPTRLMP